jgi:hypothetical protein
VRFSLHADSPDEVATLPGAIKLLGFEEGRPDRLFFLARGSDKPELRAFDLPGMHEQPVPGAPAEVLDRFLGEDRALRDVRVFVTEDAATRTHSVLVKTAAESSARSVGAFAHPGVRQPALSPDGKWLVVVQVRAGG